MYVRKWIGKQLKLSEAEQLFSASADDIEAKVEAYRQSLLIRKLDQFYVDERIDTTFTEEDIAAYYNAHKAEFKLDRPLVKGRIVRFPVNHRPVVQTARTGQGEFDRPLARIWPTSAPRTISS